jgi:hypothetical protein
MLKRRLMYMLACFMALTEPEKREKYWIKDVTLGLLEGLSNSLGFSSMYRVNISISTGSVKRSFTPPG